MNKMCQNQLGVPLKLILVYDDAAIYYNHPPKHFSLPSWKAPYCRSKVMPPKKSLTTGRAEVLVMVPVSESSAGRLASQLQVL